MSKEPLAEKDQEESIEEEETIVQKPKPKRVLNEKQKEAVAINLAKGRAKRDENRKLKMEEDKKIAEELIAKKAERIIKTKTKKEKELKTLIGLEDEESVEERIIKKPKKKKIIYREESDSEEEIIIKPKKREIITKKEEIVVPSKPVFSIKFV
jgi:hypothetical protein